MATKENKATSTKKVEKKTEMSLNQQLVVARQDLLDTRKTHRSGELVNPQVLSQRRKDIARLMTKISANKNVKEEGK